MIDSHKFVQFGGGNIGRSFVGQLFSRAGFEVAFIDVDPVLLAALNRDHRYLVAIRDEVPEDIWVEHVRGVDGRDRDACARELATCRLCGTSVGVNAVPHILPTLAAGLVARHEAGNGPLDVIIAENIHGAARMFRDGLLTHLPAGFPLDDMVGLVETSIGKMVPIMSEEHRQQDPLLVYAEAYNTLICDARGFRNPIPDVAGLEPHENMRAYVDRKLFVHNLGHACCAYFSFVVDPRVVYLWEAMENPRIAEGARRAMWESARALIAAYPDEFNETVLAEHIEDLLRRNRNRALGDTIYRIGRDLPRKLSREDRLIGGMLFDLANGVGDPVFTAHGVAAGFRFFALDERGQPFGPDVSFAEEDLPLGIEHVLREVCGLKSDAPDDIAAADLLRVADAHITERGPAFLDDLLA